MGGVLGYSIENTNALKGLLALGVILSHLSSVVENQVPGFSVSSFGYICVGCFFSLSGYALVVSQEKNENYFIGFLKNRFTKILIPYILMLIIYVFVNVVIGNESVRGFFDSFVYGYPVSNSWYVFGCLYCYFSFYLAFNSKKRNKIIKVILVLLLIIIYIVITSFIFKWGDWWYKTVICFPIGIIWGLNKQKINVLFQKIGNKYWLIVLLFSMVFTGAYFLPAINNRLFHIDIISITDLTDVLMGVTFSLLMIIFLYKINFINAITSYFGKISYEVYLYHGLIIKALMMFWSSYDSKFAVHQELLSVMVFVITIVVATIFNRVDTLIIRKITKRG